MAPTDERDFYDPLDMPRGGRNADDMFLTRLMEGVNALRFLAPLPKRGDQDSPYVGYLQHWDVTNQRSYPCRGKSAPGGGCIGCNSSNEATQRQKSRVVVPALDDHGDLRLYDFPAGTFQDVAETYTEVAGDDESIVDYTIKILGKKNQGGATQYKVILKDAPPLDFDGRAPNRENVKASIRHDYERAWEQFDPDTFEVWRETQAQEDSTYAEAEIPPDPDEADWASQETGKVSETAAKAAVRSTRRGRKPSES